MATEPRDLEKELWQVVDSLSGDSLEEKALKLKGFDLIVKVRVAGPKAKPDDEKNGDPDLVARARGKA